MIAKTSGLPHRPQNQASYVAGWVKALKDTPREIYKACRDASLIKEWVLEPEKRQELERRCQAQTKDQRQVISKRPEVVAMSKKSETIAMSKEEDLFFAMQNMGLKPSFQELALDGKFHRVATIDDRDGNKSGSYMGHSDGVPNAIITNFKTGERMHWIYSGARLSKEEFASLRKQGEARKLERDKERQERQAQATKTAYGLWNNAKPASRDHPYLKRKGIGNHDDLVRVDEKTKVIFIPVRSIDKKLQSLQIIDKEGNKRFLQDGKLEGGMLLLGKPESDKRTTIIKTKGHKDEKDVVIAEISRTTTKYQKTDTIVIAEGYATAKSIHEATGLSSVVAFSSNNLVRVTEAIREQNKEARLIIAADNDKNNLGLDKALKASEKTDAMVLLPAFTKAEQAQGSSDFNDLALSRGNREVKRQFDRVLKLTKQKELEIG